ncbi:hypothetical protein [Kibdelosporangium aridum]|uniref:Uncharacterized protein n=1 Tax=Kibdelosporangium aridum TaxID=2030 RepID=A0A1W2FW27_KIBAR|nr:hypothetical protein [Kibdelosporangium aridum]SMD25984.1 hypothetical protein SAMN05661093_09562 [Kibdelosporangium aridum]
MIVKSICRGVAAVTAVATAFGLAVGTASAAPHYLSPPSVQIGYADSATPDVAYDLTEWQHMPLGAWRDEQGGEHVSRVYATFDLSGFAGADVLGGSMGIREASAADCTKRAIEVWQTTPVTATPTWHTRPTGLRKLDESRNSDYCPGEFAFNVSAAMAAQGRVTFEIRVPADVEGDPSYGRTLKWLRGVTLTVRYNSAPSILPQYQYNAGFPCDTTAPYRRVGARHGSLQALATDPDEDDSEKLTYEFAVWPLDDPAARLVLTDANGGTTFAGTVNVPDGFLADEGTYSWQVRVSDGVATSAWSTTCSFVVDKTDPQPPTVRSDAPNQFTFDGNGNLDTRGFQYTWGIMSESGCSYGRHGIVVCPEPFDGPNKVLATTPGGTATVTLTPPHSGFNILKVRAIDESGRSSDTVDFEYEN